MLTLTPKLTKAKKYYTSLEIKLQLWSYRLYTRHSRVSKNIVETSLCGSHNLPQLIRIGLIAILTLTPKLTKDKKYYTSLEIKLQLWSYMSYTRQGRMSKNIVETSLFGLHNLIQLIGIELMSVLT